MGFLDSIERLINEHGSAVVLRERILLANDQYAQLERKVAELQSQNERLLGDNENLLARVQDLEVVRRTTQIHAVMFAITVDALA